MEQDLNGSTMEWIDTICKTLDNELWRHAIVMAGEPRSPISNAEFDAYLRDVAYTHLVLILIDECTSAGGQPILHFDSQKKVTLDRAVHGWAKRMFETSEFTLLHAFLGHGIPVPEPVFVQPASKPALEIADVLSFVTARYLARSSLGLQPDVSLEVFGNVKYITTHVDTGDLVYQRSRGWPWRVGWA